VAIGPWEIVIILLVLVIIFGAGRLSRVSAAMGKSVREFRSVVQDEPKPAAQPASVTVTAPPVTCSACQATNLATNRFCSVCGATLVSQTPQASTPEPVVAVAPLETTCPSCATLNPPGQAFCGQCGTRLTPAAA